MKIQQQKNNRIRSNQNTRFTKVQQKAEANPDVWANLKKIAKQLKDDPFNKEDFFKQDSYVTFKCGRFFRFFIYHFLFFFVTGPLTGVVLLLFESRRFLTNMGFMGINGSFMFQTLHWLFLMSGIVCYYVFNQDKYLDSIEVHMGCLATLLRCVVVAIRYATTTDSRIISQGQNIFTRKDNSKEFLGPGWKYVNPELVDQEIKNTLVHALLPLTVNIFNDQINNEIPLSQNQKYSSKIFWVYFTSMFWVNFAVYLVNLDFLEIGVIDLKRRKFLMKILEIMLEPNRFKTSVKVFCFVNYFDPQTLLSWMDMRVMILDVGKRFRIRIELYSLLFLITYALIGGVYLSWFFGGLNYELSCSYIVVGAFEILNFLYFIYMMFHIGAQINEQTTQQILRISELRNVLERLETDCEKLLQGNSKFADNLINQAFKDAALYFGNITQDFGIEESKRILLKSQQTLQIVQDRLDKEGLYNQIEILGIPLNMGILHAIQTSLISLCAAMINKKTGILT
eukprot:403353915